MCSSTVGCEFFTVDLDQLDGGDTNQFAASVSNVQLAGQASVTLERRVGGMWQTVEGPVMVDALDLYTFLVDDFHQEGTGVLAGGAYRITSDTPIVAYQFKPAEPAGADGVERRDDAVPRRVVGITSTTWSAGRARRTPPTSPWPRRSTGPRSRSRRASP